ncbi:MAG TPA: hypothetical protein PLZ50_07320 [Rubrivivax sp.]|jgi:iron-sulfur cluster assembly protein|nr:hypothetical protein [Pseudomonadota bacterium]HOL36448.1 hypothetical protein [Rubrivivax sp.]HPP83359.1 hypothetical protein [Rubrivivax sp.]
MFSITPRALAELQAAVARSEAHGMALRIAARERADGSIQFGMGFDEERENDQAVRLQELTVLLGASSRPHLLRTVLDCIEVERGRYDFVFRPQSGADGRDAGQGSGCGEQPEAMP